MNRAQELAWAAGLFEGEGCITSGSSGQEHLPTVILTLSSSDEDTLRRFASAVGVGHVSGPRVPKDGRKPMWSWHCARFEDAQFVIAALWSGLGSRRRARAGEVLLAVREPGLSVTKRMYRKVAA
jgi:hypothetical protein